MRPHPQTSDQTPVDFEDNQCRPQARGRFPYLNILHVVVACVKWIPPLKISLRASLNTRECRIASFLKAAKYHIFLNKLFFRAYVLEGGGVSNFFDKPPGIIKRYNVMVLKELWCE